MLSVPKIAALAGAFLACTSAVQASSPIAEVICAPKEEMTAKLERQFGARRVASGVRSIEQVMEVWASDASGDWTLVMTYASGKSCIVAMGEHWDTFTPPHDPA